MRNRFRGLMVGVAIGDALGRPVEGHREVSAGYVDEMRWRPRSLAYSDDTVMSMELSESLLECDGFDGADMAARFAAGYFQAPHRGYGRNVVDVFNRVRGGMHWETAASIQFEGSGSYGNGGAMRVAPVALFAYPDPEETIRLARETARVTHTHPVGVEGAVVQAVAANDALGDNELGDLLESLFAVVETDEFKQKLGALVGALERDDDEYARIHLGNWVGAQDSVVTGLYCYLLADGFEDAIVRAVRLGGDADTIAAMAGALAGARYGVEAVPDVWKKVEGYGRMIELADLMFARFGG